MSTNEVERPDSDRELAYGEGVIIAARWMLVVAGLVLALWNPAGLIQLQAAIVVILGLAVANFALQAQLLTRGPLMARVVYAASVADLAAISLLLIVSGGFPAIPYVFYLPALMAIAVTFRTAVTAIYTAATAVTYALIAVAAASRVPVSGDVTISRDDIVTVLIHTLMLGAVAVCGNVYWRLERDRRRGTPPRAAHEAVAVEPVAAPAAAAR